MLYLESIKQKVRGMALPDPIVGTPEQLVGWLGRLPTHRRYRLVEVEAVESPADPNSSASIALLRSWIAQAPTDSAAICEAEEDLRDFKRNMNLPRKETGARLHYPDAE